MFTVEDITDLPCMSYCTYKYCTKDHEDSLFSHTG